MMNEQKPLEFLKFIRKGKFFPDAKEASSLRMRIRNYHKRDAKAYPGVWTGLDLATSFSWGKTKEGINFWSRISWDIGDAICEEKENAKQ